MMNYGKIALLSKIFTSGLCLNNSSCHFCQQKLTTIKKKDENRHRLVSFQFLKACHFHIGFPTRQKPPNTREITPSPYCFLK